MKAILTYHSVDASGSVISIDPEAFDGHVRWLASHRTAVVPLSDLLALPDDTDAVAITFDDAFTNFGTEAWPRLKDCGLPVTLFVPTGYVGRTNSWGETPGGHMPPLSILDWRALARLQEDGVTLGAHSRTHPDLRALDGSALHDEIDGCIEDLRRETGTRPNAFAYPYGYWSSSAAAAVGARFQHACTTELSALRLTDSPHLLPRLDAFYLHGPGRLDNFGQWSFRQFIRLRSGVRKLGQRLRVASPFERGKLAALLA